VQEAYARATGKVSEDAATPDSKKKIPEEEDDCPICYETMYQAKEDKLVWCEECGNALHKECFSQCELGFLSVRLASCVGLDTLLAVPPTSFL
jgi:hypothetical protein